MAVTFKAFLLVLIPVLIVEIGFYLSKRKVRVSD